MVETEPTLAKLSSTSASSTCPDSLERLLSLHDLIGACVQLLAEAAEVIRQVDRLHCALLQHWSVIRPIATIS